MNKFNQGGRGGRSGGYGGGNRGGFGGRGGGFRGGNRMHQAVCDECGNQCEVPFKPTGDRPVLCNGCFKGGGKGGFQPRGGGRDFGEKKMFKAVCADCGNQCEVPFKPTGERPVLCSDCFGGGGAKSASRQNDSIKRELDRINKKLDQILIAMGQKKEHVVEKQADTAESAVETHHSASQAKIPGTMKAKKPAKKKAASKKKVVKKAVAPKKAAKKATKAKKK